MKRHIEYFFDPVLNLTQDGDARGGKKIFDMTFHAYSFCEKT